MKTLKILLKYERRYAGKFILSFLCVIVSTLLSSFLPYLLGKTIDKAIIPKHIDCLLMYLILYMFIFGANQLVCYFQIKIWANLMNNICFDVRKDMFSCILNAKSQVLDGLYFGDMLSRIKNDTEHFVFLVHANGFFIVAAFINLCMSIWYLSRIHWSISIIVIVLSFIVFILSTHFAQKSKEIQRQYRNYEGLVSSWLNEVLQGSNEIHCLNASQRVLQLWCKKLIHLSRLQVKRVSTEIISQRLVEGVNLIAQILLYTVSVILISNDLITIGGFSATVSYFVNCTNAFRSINQKAARFQYNLLSIERVSKVLNLPQDASPKEMVSIINDMRDIKIQNLSFGYEENKAVLCGIDIHIRPGDHIFLVGESGVGKSTLVNLISGLYAPPPKSIFIGDIPVENLSRKQKADHIAIVQQENIIFEGTVRFNLIFSEDKQSDPILMKILDRVGLWAIYIRKTSKRNW